MTIYGQVQRIGQVPITNGGTGASTIEGAKENLGIANNVLPAFVYKSGYHYLAGPQGGSTTTTNTNTLATDTIYSYVGYIYQPTTLSGLGFRTSSSNASVGAVVKLAIYDINADGTIGSLINQTPEIVVGDGALSTAYSASFSANSSVTAGPKLFCILPSTTTTAVRASIFGAVGPFTTLVGGTTVTAAFSTPTVGYTASRSYAAGFPTTFPATSDITAITNLPVLSYSVA